MRESGGNGRESANGTAAKQSARKGQENVRSVADLDERVKKMENLIDQIVNKVGRGHRGNNDNATEPSMTIEERLEFTERRLEETLEKLKEGTPPLKKTNKKTKYVPFQFAEVPNDEIFPQHITAKFATVEEKTQICPYMMREEIENNTKSSPLSIVTANNYSFIIKCRTPGQARMLLKTTEICGRSCNMQIHSHYNFTKGLIFIHEYDFSDTETFLSDLKESDDRIEEAAVAHFIKTRNEYSKAIIITFRGSTLPNFVDIPGESTETKVIPFKSKPMMCSKCLQYNHTKKYCRQQSHRCRKCSEEGHSVGECVADTPKCVHCGGEHESGDRSCERSIEEQSILDIQEREKVGRRRAKQMIEFPLTTGAPTNETDNFPTHFTLKLLSNVTETQDKAPKTLNPFAIFKTVSSYLGGKPVSIRGQGKDYIVQVANEEHSRKITGLKMICGKPCQIFEHKYYNMTKALIYTNDYHIRDINRLTQELRKQGVAVLEEAAWLKPKNKLSRAFIAYFKLNILPDFIDILGERSRTKVYEYKPNPMICQKCQEYSHTKNNCKKPIKYAICRRCSDTHPTEQCPNNELKCFHCGEGHRVGNNSCPKHQIEREILCMQNKYKVNRQQAINRMEAANPNYKTILSKVISTTKAIKGHERSDVRNRDVVQPEHFGGRNRTFDRLESILCNPSEEVMEFNTIMQQTPEHYTSENNPEIRNQVLHLYNNPKSPIINSEEYHPSQPLDDYPTNREELERLKRLTAKRKSHRSTSLVSHDTRDSSEDDQLGGLSQLSTRPAKSRKKLEELCLN